MFKLSYLETGDEFGRSYISFSVAVLRLVTFAFQFVKWEDVFYHFIGLF